MRNVFLYGGEGEFEGGSEFDWESPEVGSRHRFILFLAQAMPESQDGAALVELTRMGFRDIRLAPGKPIVAEALNDPTMAAFRKHYEGAFTEGSSLVWYP